MDDKYLRLLCLDNIFSEVLVDDGLSPEFLSYIGEENYYNERDKFKETPISYDSDGNIDYRYFDDFFNYNDTFQKMILKEFESFYLKKYHTPPAAAGLHGRSVCPAHSPGTRG